MINIEKKYEGNTLIETLMTLIIVGIVIIVTSATLAALIKASAISAARTLSREESEFVLELLEKEIENSKAENINVYLFTSAQAVITDIETVSIPSSIPPVIPLKLDYSDVASPGNQIHMRPISSDDWVCIGLYQYTHPDSGEKIGVLVKRTIPNLFAADPDDTVDCMINAGSSDKPVYLTSEEINVKSFDVYHYDTKGGNVVFQIDLTIEPVHWIPGPQSDYKATYVRQLIVSTEKLTL